MKDHRYVIGKAQTEAKSGELVEVRLEAPQAVGIYRKVKTRKELLSLNDGTIILESLGPNPRPMEVNRYWVNPNRRELGTYCEFNVFGETRIHAEPTVFPVDVIWEPEKSPDADPVWTTHWQQVEPEAVE